MDAHSDLSLLDIHKNKMIRRDKIDFFFQSLASLILLSMVEIQLVFGAWRNLYLSHILSRIVAVVLLITLLSLIIYPIFNKKFINRGIYFLGRLFFSTLNSVILGSFYLLTLPVSYLIGRRKLSSLRQELKPWIYRKSEWRISSWRVSDYAITLNQKKGFIRGLFFIFMREKNNFILVMLVILLLISMVILFAQSSAVAPFIYTIF